MRTRNLIPFLFLFALSITPCEAEGAEPPSLVVSTDLYGRPGPIPMAMFGVGATGNIEGPLRIGGMGWIAPTIVGPYFGGEFSIGALRPVGHGLRLGGGGTVGAFGAALVYGSPFGAGLGGMGGPMFGGFFEFLATPPGTRNFAVGFRAGGRFLFASFNGSPIPLPEAAPTFAFTFHFDEPFGVPAT